MRYSFNFYTEYHQFYISDAKSLKETNAKSFWSKEACEDRIAHMRDIVGIQTASYGNIKGELEILDREKAIVDIDLYDHIVEVSIEINSGSLQILDCPSSNIEKEIKLIPGIYRMRVYSKNLETLDNEGSDFYRIELWIDKKQEEKTILKRYTPAANM